MVGLEKQSDVVVVLVEFCQTDLILTFNSDTSIARNDKYPAFYQNDTMSFRVKDIRLISSVWTQMLAAKTEIGDSSAPQSE